MQSTHALMPDSDNTAQKSATDREGEERREAAKNRRKTKKDRRDPERVAEEIAPRRHPDLKGRRSSD